ncbi:MAG: tRNA dihydrouridine(20/20a) synthase DusA [Rhodoblastus sp.]|nr:tRNA dihydrouridine(20/20a) synthase DusA [Rhodoblastus sp.]MCC2101019.1 tRNA dihydrouridine(20/20a) synthase DusA [Hyphomicrobiales bacterium]
MSHASPIPTGAASPWRFSVAPMMDWTDRHCRFFHRLMTRHALLYTEMVTSAAVVHGHRERLIGFDPAEQPVAVQLGGADPRELAEAARICADFGYCEINLNVGCPSDRVQDGRFGACLMREPGLVAECVAAMKRAVVVPVTVKCRIGVDDQEPRQALFDLAMRVVDEGADAIIVHARKAWLQGLSPRENRDVPPLDYPLVYELKQAMPATPIAINGGIQSIAEAGAHLAHVDGVMLGRAAYHDPEILLSVDRALFDAPAPVADAHAAVEAFVPYIEKHLGEGIRLSSMTRHMLGLFAGRPGARAFRRHLAIEAVKPGAGVDVLRAAVAHVDRAAKAHAA